MKGGRCVSKIKFQRAIMVYDLVFSLLYTNICLKKKGKKYEMTKIQLISVVETEPKLRRLREKVMTRNILVNRVCREIIQSMVLNGQSNSNSVVRLNC